MTNAVTKSAIIAEAHALATTEGTSANAKIELLMSMAIASQASAITDADAGVIFDTYLDAKNAASTDKTTLAGNRKAGTDVTEGYAKKTKSEWRQVIKCGAYTKGDGPAVLQEAREVAIDKSIHVYDAIVKISREQLKVQHQLTRTDIEGLLTTQSADKDRSELKVYEDLVKLVEKIIDGIDATDKSEGRPAYPSTEAQTILGAARRRLAELTPKDDPAVTALMSTGLYNHTQAKALIARKQREMLAKG